ncbi:MAG: AGE family epimerase/isomerase [Lachnospiraceae bacterium]|nr:AGE family epimerase/isomerase [Lachnospiraceae bacterium]
MPKKRLQALSQWAHENLTQCILPFWTSDFLLDHENGGFYGRITRDMKRDNNEPRSLVLTGRMLYAFSMAAKVLKDETCLARGEEAFRQLTDRFYDSEYGGAYQLVNAQGSVVNDQKPTYSEAFLLLGCASWYDATGNQQALEIARQTFCLMEEKAKFAPGCYLANLNRYLEPAGGTGFEGKAQAPDFPKDTVIFPHHLCQAYVMLYKATGDADVGKALQEMVSYVCTSLYDPVHRCFCTMTDRDGRRVGSRQSFGHDCEISYLLQNASLLLQDPALSRQVELVCAPVLEQVLEHDYDSWGSLINGGDLITGQQEKSHVWWAQAESVTAMLYGYELTGDERYLTACERQASYIEAYFVDRENGDWYNNIVVDEAGWRIVDGMHGFDKLNGGKCPFHNSQMCFEVMERTARLLRKEEAH